MNERVIGPQAGRQCAPGPSPWLALLLLLALLGLMRDTATDMVAIWWRSETFTHAFLVPPIAAWLAWRRRAALRGLAARQMPWMLLPIALAAMLWLLAELASVAAASQAMLVALIVLSVPALFGWATARVLAFPLGFLFFAVPVGEFLVPTLINHTADFTVAALRATGVPVYREGNDFVIPSGSWSVVEACSGVRYLIASLMVGTLYAYLNYQRLSKRLAFVAVAIVMPIVANWLRAYMIVMIGHLSGNKLAVGVDHLIYGWVFFGVVIGLMFWVGARWADPEPGTAPVHSGPAGQDGQAPDRKSPWLMPVAVTLLVGGAQTWLSRLDAAPSSGTVAVTLPEQWPNDWVADAAVDPQWEPGFANPAASTARGYRRGDRTVWLWLGYYRGQGPDRKLVSSSNQLVGDVGSTWAQVGGVQVIAGAANTAVRAMELRGVSHLTGGSPRRLRVWQLYWIDGRFTASEVEVKLRQAWARLTGRGDDGAVLLFASPWDAQTEQTLGVFVGSALTPLGDQLETIRAAR